MLLAESPTIVSPIQSSTLIGDLRDCADTAFIVRCDEFDIQEGGCLGVEHERIGNAKLVIHDLKVAVIFDLVPLVVHDPELNQITVGVGRLEVSNPSLGNISLEDRGL